MKKKIAFVINTLDQAGAEVALLSLFSVLDPAEYEMSLYVIMQQGVMYKSLPEYVKILNPSFSTESVLTKQGRKDMMHTVVKKAFTNGQLLQKITYSLKVLNQMHKDKHVMLDKILWRVMSDGSERFDEKFDLAVAYLEGAATYYVADHIKAAKKASFVHIDYESSGYTKFMDKDCYDKIDRIFAVSDEVRQHFLNVYPQHADKVKVFHNILNKEQICEKSKANTGFNDNFNGIRLLTVGRLTYQKAYDIAIDAMKLLKDAGCHVRWYVLGEGDKRESLEKKIEKLDLQNDFILMGAVDNPYPYYVQSDIYVHATRFEGKSIAIQEAQILGRAIIASDCNGNREQIEDGEDGILCELSPEGIEKSIRYLIDHPEIRKKYEAAASVKYKGNKEELEQLLELA